MDLETPAPDTVVSAESPATTTAAVAAQPTPEPPAPEPDVAEHVYTDQRGQQAVPLATFLEVKKQLRESQSQVKQATERASTVEQWAQQWQPYLSAFHQRPEVLQRALAEAMGQTRPSAETTAQPTSDPEAEALAREMDLYTPQGLPDTARAQRMLAVMDARVSKRVAQEVAPVRLSAATAAAESKRAQVYAEAAQAGVPREYVDQVLQALPVELQGDAGVMQIASLIATGFAARQGRLPRAVTGQPATGPTAPIYEPLVTESPGRRGGPAPLSDAEARIVSSRQLSAEQWRKLSDTTNPVLE